MTTTRRDFLKGAGATIGAVQLGRGTSGFAQTSSSASGQRRKIIYDQDNSGPFSTDILAQLLLMQADNIDLLGITLVTGDAWLKQEAAYTLRLLELMQRPDIPVYLGAEMPMLNTKEETLLRYQLYGGHREDPWLGAFNRDNGGPDDVKPLEAPYGRFAEIKPQPEHAAKFIIKTVRENPNEVTLYAGGPLTNLALAIKLAPDIVPLVPEVVIMGTGLHKYTDLFNIFFDAEAARLVMRAPWPKFSVITVDLAEQVHQGDDLPSGRKMIEVIAERAQSPIKELFEKYAVEPYVDICTDPGSRYGDSMFWDEKPLGYGGTPMVGHSQYYMGPPPSARMVDVIGKVDADRFKEWFVDLMTRPIRKA